MLFAVFVDAEALEVNHSPRTELRLHGARDVDRRFAAYHTKLRLPVLDHVEFDRDYTRDFDGAAEGDFTVALWGCFVSLVWSVVGKGYS